MNNNEQEEEEEEEDLLLLSLQKSSQEDGNQYDEDELRELAKSLAPNVCDLLSDEAFDNLLREEEDDDLWRAAPIPASHSNDVTTTTTTTTAAISSGGTVATAEGKDGGVDYYGNDNNDDDDGDDDDAMRDDSGSEDDDGFNNELSRLGDLEDTLREELELANGGFGGFFAHGGNQDDEDDDEDDDGDYPADNEFEYQAARDAETNLLPLDAANQGEEDKEDEGATSTAATPTPSSSSSTTKKPKKEKRKKYQPILPETHDDLQSDLASSSPIQEEKDEDVTPAIQENKIAEAVAAALSHPSEETTTTEPEPKYYSLLDHFRSLNAMKNSNVDYGYETCPLFTSRFLSQNPNFLTLPPSSSSNKESNSLVKEIVNSTREYIRPPSSKDLDKMYVGLNPPTLHHFHPSSSSKESPPKKRRENLPIRTLAFRIRPDVLCGATMDGLTSVIMNLGGEMTKRQGGHLRAVLPGVSFGGYEDEIEDEFKDDDEKEGTMEEMNSNFSSLFSSTPPEKEDTAKQNFLPPILIDAQLCTKKHTKECERILLIRAYRIDISEKTADVTEEETEEYENDNVTIAEEELEAMPQPIIDKDYKIKEKREGCEILFETAALVQRIHLRGLKGSGTYYQEMVDDSNATMVDTPKKTPPSLPHPSKAVSEEEGKDEEEIMGKSGGSTEQQAGDTTAETTAEAVAPTTTTTPAAEENTSYARSFGNFLSSPLRLFSSSPSPATPHPHPAASPRKLTSPRRRRRGRGRLHHSNKQNTISSSTDDYYSGDVDIDISTLLFPNLEAAKQAVSHDLMAHYSESRSVQDFIFTSIAPTSTTSRHYPSDDDNNGEQQQNLADGANAANARKDKEARMKLMPILSVEDYPFIQSAWRFVKGCLNELDDRDLLYSTLATSSFGSFPALPTLDVHYCSQIRLLCRENMIKCLLKAASELEQYARESEFSCANLIQLLRPTFELYEMNAPALPKPVPLTAYPLEFTPPEASCPPWGLRVMEALNLIASKSNIDKSAVFGNEQNPKEENVPTKEGKREGCEDEEKRSELVDSNVTSQSNDVSLGTAKSTKSGFQAAREAASLVVSAFQRQDDEEQAARLGRKNVQVMDRLAKMQAHKRESIITIRDSYGCNLSSTKAADDFHSKAQSVVDLPKFEEVDDLQSSMDDFSPIVSGRKKGVPSPASSQLPFYAASDQVPLLKCGILLGGATGTCYVTAHQILFVTQLIPILGGNRIHLVSIPNVELVVQKPSTSILNPLPAGISVRMSRNGEEMEILSFIPSLGAHRFKSFIDVVQAVGTEDPETLKFSARGGLLYMFEESQTMQKQAAYVSSNGEDGRSETASGQEKNNQEENDRSQISDPERASV